MKFGTPILLHVVLLTLIQMGCDEEEDSSAEFDSDTDSDSETDSDTNLDTDSESDSETTSDTDTECSEIKWGTDLFLEGGILPFMEFDGFTHRPGDYRYREGQTTFDSCDLHLTGPGCLVILYGADW